MKISEKTRAQDSLQTIKGSSRPEVPPGGVRIMEALRLLLQKKDFSSITTAEISREAGANEALLYRYFKDKRGLLHRVLADYLRDYVLEVQRDLLSVHGAVNKLKRLMHSSISFYARNRIFSKILLLEVRNYPGYFESEAYELVKVYARFIDEIIKEGVRNKEIRDDVPVSCSRDVILGSIEQACLRWIIFDRKPDSELLAGNLCEAVFSGLARTDA
jgi:TetR/AcrR family transcriptional regulator, fatty acid metabolism regulator protein